MTPPAVYLQVLHHEAKRHAATVPCEHTPRNAFFLPDILRMAPEARVIVMVRDPRDVVLSQRSKWRRRRLSNGAIPRKETFRSIMAYHPINVALLWRGSINALRASRNDPRILVVRYEDLVRDPKSVTRTVCGFLGLDWSPELLAVERRGSSTTRDDPKETGVDRSRASAWRTASRRERADLALCQLICREQMTEFAYSVESLRPSPLHMMIQIVTWPIRSCLGVLMNLQRFTSPWHAIRTRLGKIVQRPATL